MEESQEFIPGLTRDRRKKRGPGRVDPALLAEGMGQLEQEIELIRQWLRDLDGRPLSDPEVKASRASYSDMLRSRQQMLEALQAQARHNSETPDKEE